MPRSRVGAQQLPRGLSALFCFSGGVGSSSGLLDSSRQHPFPYKDTEYPEALPSRRATFRPGGTLEYSCVCRVKGSSLHTASGELDFLSTPTASGTLW